MKRLMINVVLVAAGLGVSLASRTSEAAEDDMRLGTFEGNWCGFPAVFDITSREGKTWIFHGTVLLKRTGQQDEITIKQNRDNSLRIIRHLSGEHAGTNQWVDTHPPETLRRNGKFQVNFKVRKAGGYGSKALGHLLMPKE